MDRARPRKHGPGRGSAEPVEIWDCDTNELVTLIGHDTYAAPLWQVERLPPALRQIGCAFGALAEEITTGGQSGAAREFGMPGVGQIGGGGAIDRRLLVVSRYAQAQTALEAVPDMEPRQRTRSARERRPISARAMVEALCVAQVSTRAVLIAHDWPPKGRAQQQATDLLIAGLAAVGTAWVGGPRLSA